MDETFRQVERHLQKLLPARDRGKSITPETQIYRDLGLHGDDIAFDVVLWATREFGVEGTFRLADYAPGEYWFPAMRLLRKLIGKKEHQYKSFTVRDLVIAIEAKRWPD